MIFAGNHHFGHRDLNFSVSDTKFQYSLLRTKNKQFIVFKRTIPITSATLSKREQDELRIKEVMF